MRDFTMPTIIFLIFFPCRSRIRILFHLIKLEISNIMMEIWRLQDLTICVLSLCDVMPSNIILVFHPRSAIVFFSSTHHHSCYCHFTCSMTWGIDVLVICSVTSCIAFWTSFFNKSKTTLFKKTEQSLTLTFLNKDQQKPIYWKL
jgi:hypothetical protein